MNENLTVSQQDYSIYLPAVSNFYVSIMSKEMVGEGVDPKRIPQNFEKGVMGMNWLTDQKSYFNYHWNLYSAGHANLEADTTDSRECLITNRDRSTSWLLGDSGGFQIGKLVWEADWKNPNCPKAAKKRQQVLNWMDKYMDYGMCLDVPIWIGRMEGSVEKSGISNSAEALLATQINNDYFIKNRTGACKFLNVLQGEDHAEAQEWYEGVKDYCDPNKYPDNHFNGWAMGGKNNGDPELVLKRICDLRWSGLLETGVHDWMHFLGISKLEWSLMFTDIQRAIRRTHNPNFAISFDCASPFLATRNGQIYYDISLPPLDRWSYKMAKGADSKSYANDTRPFGDVLVQDNILGTFEPSPISDRLQIKDVCYYAPGDLNKLGKEGKTSWDTFSYILQMVHNVWIHIEAVQRSNRIYDQGESPRMLAHPLDPDATWRNLVNRTFEAKSLKAAYAVIEEPQYQAIYDQMRGVRKGTSGRHMRTGKASFRKHYGNI